jgi:hypothetical protein
MLGTEKLISYKLDKVDSVINFIINQLINESEDIWKVLKYNTSDALDNYDNLTRTEKLELVDKGDINASPLDTKIKLKPYNNGQIVNEEMTEIRIVDYRTMFNTVDSVEQYYQIQILTHHNLWTLDNGLLRCNVIKKELMKALNQERMNGVISSLSFDGTVSQLQYWNDNFMGYTLMLHGIMG